MTKTKTDSKAKPAKSSPAKSSAGFRIKKKATSAKKAARQLSETSPLDFLDNHPHLNRVTKGLKPPAFKRKIAPK